ncbi:MAG TPA: hypothetical protein PKK99_15600 [Bacteroidia bacterium]|nr:hypothetical protein [Bacteroidia bacterium]HNQ00486.1 hypothetical protein [Bacteroidia bacterium]
MRFLLISILTVVSLLSCTSGNKNAEMKVNVVSNEPQKSPLQFLGGLWSLDTHDSLNNSGYYLGNDGTVQKVASEENGTWELRQSDSLLLSFELNKTQGKQIIYRIDSIQADRMVLSDSSGKSVYRKVPFGRNNEGTVLSGFMGTLAPGIRKEYKFNLPPAKAVKIELVTAESGISFRFYEQDHEITTREVKSWEGILIRGGSYHVELSRSSVGALSGEAADFNVKVIGY